MARKLILIISLIMFTFLVNISITSANSIDIALIEDFNDGELNTNPPWTSCFDTPYSIINGEFHGDGAILDGSDRYVFKCNYEFDFQTDDYLEISYRGMLKSTGNPQTGRGVQVSVYNRDVDKGYFLYVSRGYIHGFPTNKYSISLGIIGNNNVSDLIVTNFQPEYDVVYDIKAVRQNGTWALYVDEILIGTSVDPYEVNDFVQVNFGTIGSAMMDDLVIKVETSSSAQDMQVVHTYPHNSSHNIPQDANIEATFNQEVDFTTIDTDTFTVRGDQSGDYSGNYSNSATTVHFDPDQAFWPGEEVTVNLSHDIQSESGVFLQPYAWQFRAAVGGGFGTFVDSGQEMGDMRSHGIALGDLDGDGDLDAFVGNIGTTSQGRPNKVWMNNGNGYFTDSGQNLGSWQSYRVDLGDLDGDGDLDAFVGNANRDPNKVWMNDGTGDFTDSGQSLGNSHTLGVKLGDLDGDGDLDAFESGHFGDPNKVWLNDGLGSFIDSGQNLGDSRSGDVALGDLDGDGDLDAFIANTHSQPNKVWLNDGTGLFTDSGQALGNSQSHGRTVLGDLDGDGDLDAFVGNIIQPNKVWLNDGVGQFTDSGQELGNLRSYGVSLGDLDGDGDLDVFVGNGGVENNKVWINNGSGIFTATLQNLGTSTTEGVALGDLDNDGDLDAFSVNNNQGNKVWFNQTLNQPPVPIPGGPYFVDEGGTIMLTGSGTDPDGDPLTFAWDLDNDGAFEVVGQDVTFSAVKLDGPDVKEVMLQVCDGVDCVTGEAAVQIENVAPSIENIIVPSGPINFNDQSSFGVDINFSDPAGVKDEFYTCEFDLDYDGIAFNSDVIISDVTGSSCSTPLNYMEPGVYRVHVVVTDKDGGTDAASVENSIVIYNPDGAVNGRFWMWSNSDYCHNHPDCDATEGWARFRFVAKYKKGASVPSGKLRIYYPESQLRFQSERYEWLVVNQDGSMAQLKGHGRLNGQTAPNGELFEFMIWAGDNTPDDDDTFRIKVWYEDNGEIVVFDNELNYPIGCGFIKIRN